MCISQDDGEIAVELLNKSAAESKVFILVRNEHHKKALESTFERLHVNLDKVELIIQPLDRYTKSRPREKFTHFFIEVQSTETGLRPNPFCDLEEKNIIS